MVHGKQDALMNSMTRFVDHFRLYRINRRVSLTGYVNAFGDQAAYVESTLARKQIARRAEQQICSRFLQNTSFYWAILDNG